MVYFAHINQTPSPTPPPPSPLIDAVACWKSRKTKACAKKLSQILVNNTDNRGKGTGLRIYVRYWLLISFDKRYIKLNLNIIFVPLSSSLEISTSESTTTTFAFLFLLNGSTNVFCHLTWPFPSGYFLLNMFRNVLCKKYSYFEKKLRKC